MSCLRAHALHHRVGDARTGVQVLRGVSLQAPPGTVTAVVGPSGAGKTTLLHLLAGLDRPASGSVVLEGRALSALPDEEVARIRRDRIGLLLPAASVLPTVTVRGNVALPQLIARRPPSEAALDATLDRVGLADRQHVPSSELTDAERQRAALARALLGGPAVILADEPAKGLDPDEGTALLELLRDVAREDGVAVVLLTRHAPAAEAVADRVLELAHGRLAEATGALAA